LLDASQKMAAIIRSGIGWQALIRKKEYVEYAVPKAKTFRLKAQVQV